MSVVGVGIDIVDIKKMKRIVSSKAGKHFLGSTFTEKERKYAKDNLLKLAGIFAAKEAVYKAFGTGWIDGRDVEVTGNRKGAPEVKLKGKIKEIAKKRKVGKIFPSISRTECCAAAVVVISS